MMSVRTPITESRGPVMPTSVMYAVPPGSTRVVARLHVRVRADDGGHATVEVVAHGHLLAGRLGVEVDDDRLGQRCASSTSRVDDAERRRCRRRMKSSPARLMTATGSPSRGRAHGEAAAGRARRVVGRPHDAVVASRKG